MYSAMLLLRSPSLYFKLSGAAAAGIIVLPVIIALVAYWRNGGFEPVDGLLNADEDEARRNARRSRTGRRRGGRTCSSARGAALVSPPWSSASSACWPS